MARISKERKVRIAGAKLDGYLPLGVISICNLLRGREAAMDDTELTDPLAIESLERSDPKVEIGIDRVLH